MNQLTIPKPCNTSWDEMLPTEIGRHCLACQKTVIDFTTWSDAQIKDFFQNQPGKVCGRFRTDQLKPYPSSNAPKLPVAPLALLALLSLSAVSTPAIAQGEPLYQRKSAKKPASEHSTPTNKVEPLIDSGAYIIKGQIWADKAPAAGVSIAIKGTNQGTTTDSYGNFEYKFFQKPEAPIKLIISYIGYKIVEKEVIFTENAVMNLGSFHLIAETTVLVGETIVTGYPASSFKRVWWKLRRLF